MNWQKLEENIYYMDGSLREIYIHGTTKNDWFVWAAFVNENYKTLFYNSENKEIDDKIDITKAFEYLEDPDKGRCHASIFIDDIQVQAYFFAEEEIENDISPVEIKSVDDHLKLANYMINLSKLLNKKVILTPENSPEIELIIVSCNDVKVNL